MLREFSVVVNGIYLFKPLWLGGFVLSRFNRVDRTRLLVNSDNLWFKEVTSDTPSSLDPWLVSPVANLRQENCGVEIIARPVISLTRCNLIEFIIYIFFVIYTITTR